MESSTVVFTTFTDITCTINSGNPLIIGFESNKQTDEFDLQYDIELPIPPPPPAGDGTPLTTSYINQLYINTTDGVVPNIPAYTYYLPSTTSTLKTLSIAARNQTGATVIFKYSKAGIDTIFNTLEITNGSWTLNLIDGSLTGTGGPNVSINGDDVIVTLPILGENVFYSMNVEKYVAGIMSETITLATQGWNMISIPASGKVSSGSMSNSIFNFNGTGYVTITQSEDLEPYKGYWVKTLVPNLEITINYNSPYSSTNTELNSTLNVASQGWNMISLPSPGKVSSGSMSNSIFHFNGTGYVTSTQDDALEIYKGYWVKTLTPNLEININSI